MKANKIFENERIIQEWFNEEGEITPAMSDLLEGHKDNIEEFIAYMIPLIKDTEGLVAGKANYIAELTKSKRTLENALKRQKELCNIFMQMFNIDKVETPQGKVSYRKSTVVNIVGEVPEEYSVIKRQDDKTKIKQALQDGKELSFATLEEKQNIQIKG